MSRREKGRQWDGVSRPVDDKYRENFDRIFGKKDSIKNKKEEEDETKSDDSSLER
jgi:hypothetical protein